MNIVVRGTRSSELQKELKAAALFYADILMHKNLSKNINLEIIVKRKLDASGYCVDESMCKNPREFTIELNSDPQSGDHIIQTLAHEMVHLKQYAKNELSWKPCVAKGKSSGTYKWKGKVCKFTKYENSYFDAPWEIESYGREFSMYNRWMESKIE